MELEFDAILRELGELRYCRIVRGDSYGISMLEPFCRSCPKFPKPQRNPPTSWGTQCWKSGANTPVLPRMIESIVPTKHEMVSVAPSTHSSRLVTYLAPSSLVGGFLEHLATMPLSATSGPSAIVRVGLPYASVGGNWKWMESEGKRLDRLQGAHLQLSRQVESISALATAIERKETIKCSRLHHRQSACRISLPYLTLVS